jgi:RimJ/RimL family protein N-acetyltransferase
MYLMMRHAFDDLGYRRYEWKCDSLNAPSRNAALRYGFCFEGIFRNAVVTKGRNRDTAWYSIIDSEWPERRARFERWLAPENFDERGKQRIKL